METHEGVRAGLGVGCCPTAALSLQRMGGDGGEREERDRGAVAAMECGLTAAGQAEAARTLMEAGADKEAVDKVNDGSEGVWRGKQC
eukprot:1851390-Rhodomonas_salina.2